MVKKEPGDPRLDCQIADFLFDVCPLSDKWRGFDRLSSIFRKTVGHRAGVRDPAEDSPRFVQSFGEPGLARRHGVETFTFAGG